MVHVLLPKTYIRFLCFLNRQRLSFPSALIRDKVIPQSPGTPKHKVVFPTVCRYWYSLPTLFSANRKLLSVVHRCFSKVTLVPLTAFNENFLSRSSENWMHFFLLNWTSWKLVVGCLVYQPLHFASHFCFPLETVHWFVSIFIRLPPLHGFFSLKWERSHQWVGLCWFLHDIASLMRKKTRMTCNGREKMEIKECKINIPPIFFWK